MMQKKNEWKKSLEHLNSCIATMKCGCSITPDERLYVDSIYYRCKEYIKAYEKMWYANR